jgi:hypothetical protein
MAMKGKRMRSRFCAPAFALISLVSLAGQAQPVTAPLVEFDSSLLPSERKIVRADLELIKKISSDEIILGDFQNRSESLQDLKKNPRQWLLERAKILVGPLNRPGFSNPSVNSVMRNLGALIAAEPGASSLTINSRKIVEIAPEMGILQFTKNPREIRLNQEKEAGALVNRIYRLGLIFHDARHSDGKAEERGIPHVACPKDHPYQNLLLCDKYVDGSFAVEILAAEALLRSYREKLDVTDQKLVESWIASRKRHIVGNEIYGRGKI